MRRAPQKRVRDSPHLPRIMARVRAVLPAIVVVCALFSAFSPTNGGVGVGSIVLLVNYETVRGTNRIRTVGTV